MNKKLRQLLILYGDEVASNGVQPPAAPEVDSEVEELRAVKEAIDRRNRRSPRPETVRAVVEAARVATLRRGAPDRPPWRRPLQRALRSGAFAAVAVTIGVIGWFLSAQSGSGDADLAASKPANEAVRADAPTPTSRAEAESDRSAVDLVPAPRNEIAVSREQGPGAARSPSVRAADGIPALAGNGEATESRPAAASEPVSNAGADAEEALAAALSARRDETARFTDANMDATFSKESTPAVFDDLSWDESAEVWALYERVERLNRTHPTGAEWRATPVPQALSAPVGLARTQHSAVRQPQ